MGRGLSAESDGPDFGPLSKPNPAAAHMLAHPGDKFFDCPICRRRHRADEDCTSNPGAMEIQADDRDLARVTQHAFEALMVSNRPPRNFRFSGQMVRLIQDERQRAGVEILTFQRLRYEMATAAQWVTTRTQSGASSGVKQPAMPPRDVIENMLARPIADVPLPILRGIVHAPVVTATGHLAEQPGYDPTSALFYAPANGFDVAVVPAAPSQGHIDSALTLLLQELLGDFPFVSPSDCAAALTLLLLPFVREQIDGPVPIIAIEKPTIGTGASLLVELLTFPATGVSLTPMNAPRQEEEMRKRITASLLRSPAYMFFDNVSGRFASESLAAVVTSTEYEDRRLGHTETLRVPVRCGWVITGNNPVYDSELIRRTVRCRLDAQLDRPWLREVEGFRHPNIRQWAAAHRADLVWAALVLVRSWLAAGRPAGAKSLGSFERWSAVMGGIFETVGVEGFLENLAQFYDDADAETMAWRDLIGRWAERFSDREVGSSDLWVIVNPPDGQGDPIDIGLGDGTEKSQKTRLGKRLHAARDKRFGTYQIIETRKRQGAQLWRLKMAEPVNVVNLSERGERVSTTPCSERSFL